MSKELMGRIAALEEHLGVARKASESDVKKRLAAEIEDLEAQLDEEVFDDEDVVEEDLTEEMLDDPTEDLTEEPTLDELEASLEIAEDDDEDDDEDDEMMQASESDPTGIEEEITQDSLSAVQGEQHGEQLASSPSMLEVGRQVGRGQVASTMQRLKQASRRLDRVAEYLEKHGRNKLAFRVDRIADAVDMRIKSIS